MAINEYLNKKSDIADKVAAGLRKMNRKPDALLFFDDEDFFYDKDKFLDIPVFRTSFLYQSYGTENLKFYPLFLNVHKDDIISVSQFRRGYEEQ
jgi:hypothetical protein